MCISPKDVQIKNQIFNLDNFCHFSIMIHRHIADQIKTASQQMPVVSVTGPRQSGKTTICKEVFPDYFYANLENPETRYFALEDPKQFLAQGEKGMVIDEARLLFIWDSYS